jgi:hypothetical protein
MQNGDLAGGNYYYSADGFTPDYTKGHNVLGISQREDPPMDVPPGFKGDVVIPGGRGPVLWQDQKQLNCSGTWGCHGNRTIEDPFQAMEGAHHTDDSVIDGTTVGNSYRFLLGVKGKEHANWEYQATVTSHNGYRGDGGYSAMDTISYLCGECHGRFHPHAFLGGTEVIEQNTWHKHPSDIAFSAVHGGYAGSEYSEYITYTLEAPVAYANPTGGESVVDENSIIMCISCHRAHGSPYSDMSRWNYALPGSGGGSTDNGCLACHTQK